MSSDALLLSLVHELFGFLSGFGYNLRHFSPVNAMASNGSLLRGGCSDLTFGSELLVGGIEILSVREFSGFTKLEWFQHLLPTLKLNLILLPYLITLLLELSPLLQHALLPLLLSKPLPPHWLLSKLLIPILHLLTLQLHLSLRLLPLILRKTWW
jgi:hypothetical protein